MSEAWKQWEGQIVDAKFPLRRFLGGSDHSAVFLTERGDPPQKSAIKFIQVDEPDAELQLFRWKHAAKLSHPHLLRIFESGRCRLGDFDLLYVLMEYAEENLAQFLPQRPLTPAEARDVLAPMLQALGFLHGESLAHGRVKPSNILAIEDQLKLSSDAIFSFAEAPHQSQLASAVTQPAAVAPSLRQPTAYDPPEAAKGVITAAGDIWSLGITLVEALTQRLPVADPSPRQDPVVPETLPAVFLDIARNCLHRDPQKRWTVVEIAARLNPRSVAPSASAAQPAAAPSPAPVAAAAVAGISPAAPQTMPMSATAPRSEPARKPTPAAAKSPSQTQTIAVRSTAKSRYDSAPPHLQRPPLLPKFNYLPLGIVVALVLAALLLGPRLLRHRAPAEQAASVESQSAPSAKPIPAAAHPKSSSKSSSKTPPPTAPAAQPSQHAAETAAPNSLKKTSEKQPLPTSPVKATPTPTPVRADVPAKPPAGAVTQGEVLSEVMPDVSKKARATIRGTVRVAVKLHIDPAGNVASAELFSHGPSKYFADQALQAAHRWDFSPAKVDGHAVASEWLIRFEFKPAGTKAHSTQSTP